MNNLPKPINEYIIIAPDKEQSNENAFLSIPDELKDKPKTGVVVAASEGYYAKDTGVFIPIEAKRNDRVLYNTFGLTAAPIRIGEETYLLLRSGDIILILNK